MLSAINKFTIMVVSNVGVIAIISSENACDIMSKTEYKLDLQYN